MEEFPEIRYENTDFLELFEEVSLSLERVSESFSGTISPESNLGIGVE